MVIDLVIQRFDEIIKGTRQVYFLQTTNKKLSKISLLCKDT